jgi:O-antigen/teichoic acid export membrane protein
MSANELSPEKHTDLGKLASEAGLALGGRLLGRFVGVVGDIMAARILGPEIFGLYAIGWTILRVIGLFAPLGLDKGILRFGAKNLNDQDDGSLKGTIVGSISMALLFSLFLCCSFLVLSPWLANVIFRKPDLIYIFRIIALTFPLITLLPIVEATTRLTGSVKYSVAIQDISQPVVALLLLVILYLGGLRLNAILFSDLLSFLFAVSFGIFFISRLFPVIFKKSVKPKFIISKLFLFSFPTALAGVFGTFLFWVDRLIIGYYRPAYEGGIYQAVSQTSTIFAVILGGFNAIVVPMISNFIHKGELERLQKVFRASTKWGLYLSLPVFIVIIVFPRDVLLVLFGNAYASGWSALLLLSIGQLVNIGTGAVGLLLVLAGLQNYWLALSLTAFLLNILLNWFLVPLLGINGAAIGTSISVTCLFFSAVVVTAKVLHITPYDRGYIKGILSAFIVFAIVLPIRVLQLKPLYLLILVSIISACAFFTLVVIFRLDSDDREFLSGIVTRFARFRFL